jgi:hypothetical protein
MRALGRRRGTSMRAEAYGYIKQYY